ncbi:MAG: dihydrodipicolinate synthase family protein [Gammaproteobacteria bacterium]
MTDAIALEDRTHFGVWAPVLTALDDDLNPDIERTVAHAVWLLESGCHGLGLFGTTGEANSFSVEERMEVLEGLLDAEIPTQRLIVGTGCCALTDTVRLTTHAVRLGCKSVLMLPPFYYKNLSDNALFESYREVIERVGEDGLRVVLYHFPQLSGVPITRGAVELLSDYYPEVIAGIKDSSGEWKTTSTWIADFPNLCVFPGSEVLLLRALRSGGAGCITATANVNPAAIRNVYDTWLNGSAEADAEQERITAVRQVIETRPMIPGLKCVVGHYAQDARWQRVRPPLAALHVDQGEELLAELAATGFRFSRAA